MHLLIFDPHDRGHYLTFVRYMVESDICVDRVTVALHQRIADSEAFRIQLQPYLRNVEVSAAIGPGNYGNAGMLFQDLCSTINRHKPDHVWIPSGDIFSQWSCISRMLFSGLSRRGIEIECGLIGPFHRPPRRWRGHARQALEKAVLYNGPWTKFHLIDSTAYAWIRRRKKRFGMIPDPIGDYSPLTKLAARKILGIPDDGYYFGAVGIHSIPRKGTGLLVEAFSKAKLPSNSRLLLAGPVGVDLQQRLDSDYAALVQAGRIHTLDHYLEEDELMASLAASDVVCTPYKDHYGSSGIVLRAAQAGRPVLAPNYGWFAEMVPAFELGTTDDILKLDALIAALESAEERFRDFRPSPACKRLLEYSSAENFGRHWGRRLRERQGLPADRELRTWEWVTTPGQCI